MATRISSPSSSTRPTSVLTAPSPRWEQVHEDPRSQVPGDVAPPPQGPAAPDGGLRVREGGETSRRRQRRPPELPAPALGAGTARPGEASGGAAVEGGEVPDHEVARELRLLSAALGQQDAGGRTGALRVHRQARKRAAGGEPRDREVDSAHSPGRLGLAPGPTRGILPGN